MTVGNRTAGTMDKYELANYLEVIARGIRNGSHDVQSVFEGLEISSKELDGFCIHIAGHINRVIPPKPTIRDQVVRMFHERHHTQGPWIENIIDEADYRLESFFEYNDDIIEDAFEMAYNANLLYQVALALYNTDDLWNSDWIHDIASDAIGTHAPSEIYVENQ
jgi:hypothetical protein